MKSYQEMKSQKLRESQQFLAEQYAKAIRNNFLVYEELEIDLLIKGRRAVLVIVRRILSIHSPLPDYVLYDQTQKERIKRPSENTNTQAS